ncbi:AraC family transcriptional regulator [Amphritea balenae]|uniref:AraC family transcriptional regulator n=1 Tax=Amphritea balenae TaxID=452629 RepID=A0A3P1SX17_9GAMM|nr:AraC family transcriptional regulator [Amphritea balenae]RRD01525.1 AraC family transcriptional regulator [Amphritea balenae]GGK56289.1 AraC family transcriptional regulator [Amphritea balenae]
MNCRTSLQHAPRHPVLSAEQRVLLPSSRVDDTLAASNAVRRNLCELPGGVSFSHWANDWDRVSYQNLNHHTLSIYLQGGGSQIRRSDLPQLKGEPGSVCLFPVGHDSQWEIDSHLEFIHLYFSDDALRQLALTALDLDPRCIELPDLTYASDPQLVQMLHRQVLVLQWQDSSDRLALQQSSEMMLLHLLKHYVHLGSAPELFRGGLTRAVRDRVIEYMRCNLAQAISLEQLALVAQLSQFHFNRMFRISMACTPHQYLTRLRIEHAKQLLETSAYKEPSAGGKPSVNEEHYLSLATIGQLCGFSNQSHFGRTFKQYVGVTPAQYRKTLG